MIAVTPVRAALLIGLVTAACHAPLPFTDSPTYDDRYHVCWLAQGRLDYLRQMYSMHGNLPAYAYFSLFDGLPDPVPPFKALGVVLAALTGWLVWRVGTASGFLTAAEALLAAAAVVALPVYKVKGGVVYSMYDWPPAAFLLAVLLALRAEGRTGWPHAARRAAALGLFTASFLLNSLLMFYGGFVLLLVLARQRATGRRWYQLPAGFLLARPDYLALPFAYWAAKHLLFARSGPYARYNEVAPTWDRVRATAEALPGIVADPVVVTAGLSWPILLGIGIAAAGAAAAARLFRPRPGVADGPADGPAASPVGLVAFGLILAVLATFPYAAVGKPPAAWGAPSSYTPLVPLAFAVLLLGVVKGLARALPRPAFVATVPPAVALFGACCVVGWWHNTLSIQAQEARNRAVVRAVRAHPQARGWTVYYVANRYPIPRTTDNLHGWEWVFIESGPAGPARSFAYNGIPTEPTIPAWYVRQCLEETTLGFAFGTIDPDGPQGAVVVRPGTDLSPPRVGLKYLWTKYTRPDRLDSFLDRLVRVEFYPAPIDPAAVGRRADP